MTCYMMRGWIIGTDSTRKLLNSQAKMTCTSQSAKKQTKENGGKKKSQMRAEFKLCYKGFKSSGSLSFEDMYLHTTPACQNSTRHMIVSFYSPGMECS